MEDLLVVPLHQHTIFMFDCCKLINSEWPRSETARLHSLNNSCDTLPVSLVLLKDKQVIGHCKLSRIPTIIDSCFIESVVIKNDLRGKGLGSYLMKQAEEYCKNILELKTIHLSTKGQEKFYRKLGYKECDPISIYGSSVQKSVPKVEKISTSAPVPPPLPKYISNYLVSKTYMFKNIN